MTTVLIADDHPAIRSALKKLLRQRDIKVIETGRGADVVSMAERSRPDLVVLDLEMEPGWSAGETVKQLKALGLHVAVFTGHSEYKYVQSMLDLHVDGYLLKDDSMEIILIELIEILGGERRYSSKLTKIVFEDGDKWTAALLVLQVAADDLTVREIARDMHVSERTVRGYLSAAREVIDAETRCGAVAKALRKGLIV